MIFWLVLKFEIRCRGIFSWRILLVLLEKISEDYFFAWWNIWVFIILRLPLRYVLNVNGKAKVWHTPCFISAHSYDFATEVPHIRHIKDFVMQIATIGRCKHNFNLKVREPLWLQNENQMIHWTPKNIIKAHERSFIYNIHTNIISFIYNIHTQT
jgi:hypothetical protein